MFLLIEIRFNHRPGSSEVISIHGYQRIMWLFVMNIDQDCNLVSEWKHPSSAAYMRQWIGSALVQIMTYLHNTFIFSLELFQSDVALRRLFVKLRLPSLRKWFHLCRILSYVVCVSQWLYMFSFTWLVLGTIFYSMFIFHVDNTSLWIDIITLFATVGIMLNIGKWSVLSHVNNQWLVHS